MQKSAEVGDIPLLSYIEKKNDSIVKIRSFDSNKLSDAL
jgi:beta-mannanase